MNVALTVFLFAAAASPAQAPAAGESHELRVAQALVESVSKSVAELRGLAFKRPVALRLVTPEECRAYFQERASKQWPPEKVRVDQAVYTQLGLIPPGTKLLALFLDLLQEQARGFYDPGSDTFFLLHGLQDDALKVIMAHELTHALDDQHHDIDRAAEQAQDDDDGTALAAVVEGSGTLIMTAYMLEEVKAGRLGVDALARIQQSEAQAQGGARLGAAPVFIQRTLVAPYTLGLAFLLRGNLLGVVGGVKKDDLERAFSNLPTSTEQVLHPEKYWDEKQRETPGKLRLPDLAATLGKGYRLAGQGTLGELGLAVLTGAGLPDLQSASAALPSAWTNRAAEGWKADRFHYYANGDLGLTVLLTAWDSEDDAREFESGLAPVAGRRTYRYGSSVLLVGGATQEQADALAPLLLQTRVQP